MKTTVGDIVSTFYTLLEEENSITLAHDTSVKSLVLSPLCTYWKCITQNEAMIDLNAV